MSSALGWGSNEGTFPGTKAGTYRSHPRQYLPPPGRTGWTARHGRAVTANVSIRSVGALSGQRIYIEDVYPTVDAGRFPVKRVVGEEVDVWADIIRDGHAVLAAELLWRREGADKWSRAPMTPPQHHPRTPTF